MPTVLGRIAAEIEAFHSKVKTGSVGAKSPMRSPGRMTALNSACEEIQVQWQFRQPFGWL